MSFYQEKVSRQHDKKSKKWAKQQMNRKIRRSAKKSTEEGMTKQIHRGFLT